MLIKIEQNLEKFPTLYPNLTKNLEFWIDRY